MKSPPITLVLTGKLLRDIRWPLALVMLLLFLFTLLWVRIAQRVTVEIAPFFQGVATLSQLNPKVFEEVLFRGPGRISQAVMGGGEVRFENPTDFLAVELLHPVILTLAGLWSIGRAAGAIAGELDRGTLELLLSQPISRTQLILSHLLVDAVALPLFVLSIAAGLFVGLQLVGPFQIDYSVLEPLKNKAKITWPAGPDVLPVDTAGVWGALANLLGLLFAMSGMTLAISSLCRSRWRATALAAGIVLAMFILNVICQLWESIADLRPLSLFFYYQPQKIWLKSEWTVVLAPPDAGLPVIAVLTAAGISGYLFAWISFKIRDLPAPL